jgi:hypothetical protein
MKRAIALAFDSINIQVSELAFEEEVEFRNAYKEM